jgi:hypothetical protein
MSSRAGVSRTVVLLITELVVLSAVLAAQEWNLDTYAGRASYKVAPGSVASQTGVLGIRFNQDRRIFQAAVAAPFSNEDVMWGMAEVGDRFAIRRGDLAAGADVSLFAHGQRDRVANIAGHGLVVEALPMVSRRLGAGVLEVRSGPRWYGAWLGDADWTRTLWTTDLRAGIAPGESLGLESSVRHERGQQGEAYTRAGFSVAAMLGRTTLRGSLGGWVHGVADANPEWEFSVAIPLRPNVSISTTAGHESFSPQFLGPPRTSWSAGMTFRIGGRRAPARDTVAETHPNSRIVLRLPLQEVHTPPPSVAGDFTNWMPVRMERGENEWRLSVELPAGVHHFAYLNADGKWFVPESAPNRTDDGMGGWVAVLVIP